MKTEIRMKFSGIDPWLSYSGYRDYRKKSTFDELQKMAIERLSPQVVLITI